MLHTPRSQATRIALHGTRLRMARENLTRHFCTLLLQHRMIIPENSVERVFDDPVIPRACPGSNMPTVLYKAYLPIAVLLQGRRAILDVLVQIKRNLEEVRTQRWIRQRVSELDGAQKLCLLLPFPPRFIYLLLLQHLPSPRTRQIRQGWGSLTYHENADLRTGDVEGLGTPGQEEVQGVGRARRELGLSYFYHRETVHTKSNPQSRWYSSGTSIHGLIAKWLAPVACDLLLVDQSALAGTRYFHPRVCPLPHP